MDTKFSCISAKAAAGAQAYVYTLMMKTLMLCLLLFMAAREGWGQSILWSSTGGSAWLTGSNWTGGNVPSGTQIAQFGANPTGVSGVGINFNNTTNAGVQINGQRIQEVAAVEVTSARAATFLIGNSSTTAGATGQFRLNGTTVNSIDNTILRNNSNQLFTIQNTQSSGTQTMSVILGNTTENVINIDSTGGITISSVITGTGRNLTKGGTGAGVLELSGQNTFTGTTTVNGGTLRLNRSGGGTLPSGNDVVVNSGGTLRISTAQTLNNVTVNAGGTLIVDATLTVSGTATINGTFQINQGGWATGGTWSYGAGGTLVFNNSSGSYNVNSGDVWWPSSSGPTNVTVQGAGGITMNVARTVSGTFQTAAGVTNANNLTLNGTAQINAGGFFTGAPTYGSASTLVYNSGSTYGRGNEWSATSGAGYPNNVTINAGSSLDLGNGGTGTARQMAGNLTINGGFFMDFGSNDMTQPLTVLGNVTIGNTGTLSLSDAIGGDMVVRGDWTRNGTFNPKNRLVSFNAASGDQSITGATTFDFFTVNKSSGNVVLNNDITVNQTLTLTNGRIQTGSNRVILTASGTVSGGNTGSYIFGNLQRRVSSGLSNFPVGSASVYAPVILNITGVSGAVDITGTAILGDHPNQATAPIHPTNKANHYWTFTKTGAGGFTNYTAEFNLSHTTNGGTLASYKIAKFDSPSTWSAAGGSVSGALVTSASFTSFSDFVAGEENSCVPVSALSYSSNPAVYCKDAAITNNTPTITGDTPISWSVSPALPSGLNLNASTGVISGTPTVAAAMATYTVTATNACGSTTAGVVITVNEAPSALNYTSNTVAYCVNAAITANTPTFTGSPATSWAISPALPSGLVFNTSTGVISGTPDTPTAAADYTVTVTNSCGSTTRVVNITVHARPTATTCYIGDPCQASAGQIIVNISGGATPYTVGCTGVFTAPHPSAPGAVPGITSPVTVSMDPGTATFSGLPGNANYTITVTDANNCTAP